MSGSKKTSSSSCAVEAAWQRAACCGTLCLEWSVRDTSLRQRYALKVLSYAGQHHHRRLLQEGKAQSVLSHPYLLPVHTVLEVYGRPALLLDSIASLQAQMLTKQEAYATLNLVMVDRNRRQPGCARQQYERARALLRRSGERRNVGVVLGNLGLLLNEIGDKETAAQMLRQARDIHREMNNPRHEAHVLWLLAELEHTDPEPYYLQALEILERAPDPREQASIYASLANPHLRRGNIDKAEVYSQDAITISVDIAYSRCEGYARCVMGTVLMQRGELQDAMQELDRAELLLKSNEMLLELAENYSQKAHISLLSEDVVSARRYSEEMKTLIERTDAPPDSDIAQRYQALQQELMKTDT